MNIAIKDFMMEWNRNHDQVKFSIFKASGTNRPLNISVRYPELSSNDCSPKDWGHFETVVEEKSGGVMIIVTNEKAFRRGIIDIAVATRHSGYNDDCLAETLEWLGNYLES